MFDFFLSCFAYFCSVFFFFFLTTNEETTRTTCPTCKIIMRFIVTFISIHRRKGFIHFDTSIPFTW